ncbi:hypothetical protein F5144DRAFT_280672 [Chaetomium tenue]|uniref:Uncharacterized protein n=1 Tax=Chaetomium tenue TaxID=1854479 RepID=A0ACB7P3A3_9PEZI|nr:hypothetical protein F5144DRAFT_280672 [Chaetomium globosum]
MDRAAKCAGPSPDEALITAACTMPGNPDLYGIGIRLGFYFQWINLLLVTYLQLDHEMLHRTINILLQVGVFAIMLLHTHTRSLRAADAATAFWLLVGALSSLTRSDSSLNPRLNSRLIRLSNVVRMTFYTMLSGYVAWLWFGGIDELAPRSDDDGSDGEADCDTIVFFGRATTGNNAFRGLARTAGILGALLFFTLTVRCVREVLKSEDHGEDGTESENKVQRILSKVRSFLESKGGDKRSKGRALVSVALIIICIGVVEYVIRANQMVGIGDLSAVEQLIPFLIGLFGFLDLVMQAREK